jgi:hypothetical protein
MDNSAPPLKLWFFVSGIVIFFLGGFFGYAYVEFPNSNVVGRLYSARIKKAIMKNDIIRPRQKSIVIFGSSLAHCDLPNVPEIEKMISDSNKKATVLRIAIHAFDMKKAEYSNFFSHITKYPPNYLFVETNDMNIDESNGDDEDGLPTSVLIDLMLKKMKEILGAESTEFNRPPPIGTTLHKDGFDTATFKKFVLSARHVRKFSDNKIANAAFAALIKHKTKVIFLELPLCARLNKVYLSDNEKIKLQRLYDTYLKTYGIPTWKYPVVMDDSDFLDGGHLNYKGGKKYEDWFATEFNKLK